MRGHRHMGFHLGGPRAVFEGFVRRQTPHNRPQEPALGHRHPRGQVWGRARWQRPHHWQALRGHPQAGRRLRLVLQTIGVQTVT
eukprot:14282357-Alexandrium_andersonii.AAC.1